MATPNPSIERTSQRPLRVSSSSTDSGWESRSDSCIELGFVSGLLSWFGEFDVMLNVVGKVRTGEATNGH